MITKDQLTRKNNGGSAFNNAVAPISIESASFLYMDFLPVVQEVIRSTSCILSENVSPQEFYSVNDDYLERDFDKIAYFSKHSGPDLEPQLYKFFDLTDNDVAAVKEICGVWTIQATQGFGG